MFLFLNLESNHTSQDTRTLLESDHDELLDSLKLGLEIPIFPKRTKRDEAQITSLFRALLELSGGQVDCMQHRFAEDYTANQNNDLLASIFDITRSNNFGEFDTAEMCTTLSKSPVFSEMTISVQDLEDRTLKLRDSLQLGFPQDYLVWCPNGRL